MDFDRFIAQAWDDHAANPQAVAQRLADTGVALLAQESQIAPLANLAHHVHGEHLGQWALGLAFQQSLTVLPLCQSEGPSGQALRRFSASLGVCSGAGAGAALEALGDSDRIRVFALASSALAAHDIDRARVLFGQALSLAEASGLPDSDPMNRALAVTGNNLAAALEEKADRSDAERELMLLAAQTARRYWSVAGGWLETERAEYRLAMSWLRAGDALRARHHAEQCLRIVQEHGEPVLELFFAREALCLAARADSEPASHAAALAQAQNAFAALTDGDKAWCQASLDKLRA